MSATSLLTRVSGLRKPVRVALAFGVFSLAALGVTALLVWPALQVYQSHREWRVETAELFARHNAVHRDGGAVVTALQAASQGRMWGYFYPVLSNGASASTSFQTDVVELLNGSGAQVQSVVPLPRRSLATYHEHTARIAATLTIDELRGLLQAISSHQRFLAIRKLSINAPLGQAADDNPELQLAAEIAGFEMTGEPPRLLNRTKRKED